MFLALLLCLTGCGICRRSQPVAQRDSVWAYVVQTVRERDTVVMWQPPEGTSASIVPDADTSRLRTSLAESEAWVTDGELHHTLRNRSELRLPISIRLPEYVTERSSGLIRERTVEVAVDKPLNGWQKFWIRLGQIAALFVVGYILIKRFIIPKG